MYKNWVNRKNFNSFILKIKYLIIQNILEVVNYVKSKVRYKEKKF